MPAKMKHASEMSAPEWAEIHSKERHGNAIFPAKPAQKQTMDARNMGEAEWQIALDQITMEKTRHGRF